MDTRCSDTDSFERFALAARIDSRLEDKSRFHRASSDERDSRRFRGGKNFVPAQMNLIVRRGCTFYRWKRTSRNGCLVNDIAHAAKSTGDDLRHA